MMTNKLKVKSSKLKSRGVTLYIAIAIMSVLLLVSFAAVNIAIKSSLFSSMGRESQMALFAADAGAECAMYWDIVYDKFATSTPGGSITCFDPDEEEAMYTGASLADFGESETALVGGGGDEDAGSGSGTITKVNVATGSAPSGTLGNSISTGSFNTASGNLIVVAIRFNRTTFSYSVNSVTDSAGNNYIPVTGVQTSTRDRLEIWYAKNTNSAPTNVIRANFNGPVTYRVINAIQYSGVDKTNPLDTSAISGTVTNSTTVTSNQFTTTSNNEVIVAAAQVSSLDTVWASGPGYTKQVEDTRHIVLIEDKIVSSIQNGITASAITTNKPATTLKNIIVATFKAAGGGTGGPTSRFGFKMNLDSNPTQGCALVTVEKVYIDTNSDGQKDTPQTTIKSKGYNTCDTTDPRRVERGVELVY